MLEVAGRISRNKPYRFLGVNVLPDEYAILLRIKADIEKKEQRIVVLSEVIRAMIRFAGKSYPVE